MMRLELVPFKSVGKYHFKEPVEQFKSEALRINEKDISTGWITYEMPHGVSLYVERGLIESVVCKDSCYYAGLDLISTDRKMFENLFKLKKRRPEDLDKVYYPEFDDNVDVIEYDEVGIQGWFYNGELFNLICSYE